MKLSIVMPAYNERGTIREILKQVLAVPLHTRVRQLGKILQGVVHLPLSHFDGGLHIAYAVHLYASALSQPQRNPSRRAKML